MLVYIPLEFKPNKFLWTNFLHLLELSETQLFLRSNAFLGTLPWLIPSSIQDIRGFPDSSVGKESTCNAGDPGLIPGSGKSSGEGIGYLLQCFWASLVAQWVKNLPAMWETWVWFLGWDYALENEIWRTLQYSGLENSMGCISPWGQKESDMTGWTSLHFTSYKTLTV